MDVDIQTKKAMTAISERLLIFRRRLGLSQVEMAERLGYTSKAYRNYELSIRDVPLSVILTLHREFSADVSWLLLGEHSPETIPPTEYITRIFNAFKDFEKNNAEIDTDKKVKIFNYLCKKYLNNEDINNQQLIELINLTL